MFNKIVFRIAVSITCLLMAANGSVWGEFKKMPSDKWTAILQEMNINPDAKLVEKLVKSGETIEKIQKQTKGNLKQDNWVEIFRKLDIQPKKDMQPQEWAAFFEKISLTIKGEAFTAAVSTSSSTAGLPLPGPAPKAGPGAEAVAVSSAAAPAPLLSATTGQGSPAQESQETPVPGNPAPQPVVPQSTPAAPPPVRQPEKPEKSVKISMDLKGADIFSTLKMISQRTGMSIVASSSVKGNVTIYLQDVDAMDAFKMILEMNDLAYVQESNVFMVMPSQDYEKVYGKKFYDATQVEVVKLNYTKVGAIEKTITPLKSKIGQVISDTGANMLILIDTPENIKLLKNLVTNLDVKMESKTFNLNYAKPKDVADKLKNIVTPNIGEMSMDERTARIVITDFPSKVEEAARLIESFDRRHQEVLVEAKIMQIMLNDEFKMGVNWESVFDKVNDRSISGKVTANLSAIPVGSSGVRLSVGTLAVDNFNVMYDVLQSVGNTNLVSSPKIATIENQEAKILVGTKEAYVTTTITTPATGVSTTAESVSFIDVGVKLYVTPSVGEDGFITMKIRPEVSSVERNLITAQGNSIPIIRTSESETTVMVKDGMTIVIAGLMEERKESTVSGIPLLCQIPIIGLPFRRTNDVTRKTELAVFLTPHIMSGEMRNITQKESKRFHLKD